MTRYYNLGTTGFYNIDTNRQGILDSWIILLMNEVRDIHGTLV